MLRTQFYGIVERANAIIGHFRPVARAAVLAKPRLAPPLLAKAVFAMSESVSVREVAAVRRTAYAVSFLMTRHDLPYPL